MPRAFGRIYPSWGHCIVVEKAFRLLNADNPRITYEIVNVGSWAGLTAMMLRQADIAGIHIFDDSESTYNQPLLSKFGLSRSYALIRGHKRQQCLMVSFHAYFDSANFDKGYVSARVLHGLEQ